MTNLSADISPGGKISGLAFNLVRMVDLLASHSYLGIDDEDLAFVH
jgi:hypothetical protein